MPENNIPDNQHPINLNAKNKDEMTEEQNFQKVNDIILNQITEILKAYKCVICQEETFSIHPYHPPFISENYTSLRVSDNNIKVECDRCGHLTLFSPSAILKEK